MGEIVLDKTEFDVIILGTGLVESLLAASLSLSGKKILHLDRNDFYGGAQSSFPLNEFVSLLQSYQNPSDQTETPSDSPLPEGYDPIPIESKSSALDSVSMYTRKKKKQKPQKQQIEKSETQEKQTNEEKLQTIETETQSETTTKNQEKEKEKEQEEEKKEEEKEEEKKEEEEEEEEDNEWKKESRRYSIDLRSRYIYCSDEMVDILVRTGVFQYIEFKNVKRAWALIQKASSSPSTSPSLSPQEIQDLIQSVPCSKGDIFRNNFISLIEKRLLMKFLDNLLQFHQRQQQKDKQQKSENESETSSTNENTTEPVEHEFDRLVDQYYDQPFIDFLKTQRLTPTLETFLIYSIVLAPEVIQKTETGEEPVLTTKHGIERILFYVTSSGKYENLSTPWLYPLYGIGELVQAFCRLAAVWGGVYVLRQTALQLLVSQETNRVDKILSSQNQLLNCKYFVTTPDYLPRSLWSTHIKTRYSLVGLCVSTTPIISQENDKQGGEESGLIVIPPLTPPFNQSKYPIHIYQLDPSLLVSPKTKYLIHFVRESGSDSEENPETVLKECVNRFVPSSSVLFTSYYRHCQRTSTRDFSASTETQNETQTKEENHIWNSNVIICSETDPDRTDTTFGSLLQETEEIFKIICPDKQFFAPVSRPGQGEEEEEQEVEKVETEEKVKEEKGPLPETPSTASSTTATTTEKPQALPSPPLPSSPQEREAELPLPPNPQDE